ncbi:MAG: NAD-dependent epimerase/dehydratase family protein [Candidatus Hermodarchaeota archaeon]
MTKKVLVTGGAGFIGSHLVDNLIQKKRYEVTILDSLEPQVHGDTENPPLYLNNASQFFRGSVIDYEKFEKLIKENEMIFHLAASVGVGQSMYQIKKYIDNNIQGLAHLLDILVNCDHNVEKVIIASSNTVYGEAKSQCNKCGIVFPRLRKFDQLEEKDWDLNCPECGSKVIPLLTDENSPLNPSSVYAFSKQAQEKLGLMIGDTYGIKTTVLRFFLVYGTRQALSNPYTGICSIFSTRALHGKPPIIFEDGNQTRDFINVKDVCQALILASEKNAADGEIFNVGTGIPITIKQVAETISEKIDPNLKPIYSHQFRVGDIRHCVADITKIKSKLGFSPSINFREGIDDLIEWIRIQKDIKKPSDKAIQELKEKGLLK